VPGVNWLRNAHHLKIWQTAFVLANGYNIYVGLVNANDGLKWGILPIISPDLDNERELLYGQLDQTGKIESNRKLQLVQPVVGTNFIGDQFFTDGKADIITLR
jgi:undecaprenyl-diphosphatase